VSQPDRSSYPSGRRRRGRGFLRPLAAAVPAALLITGLTAAGVAGAAAAAPAAAGQRGATAESIAHAGPAGPPGAAAHPDVVRASGAGHAPAAAGSAAPPVNDGYGPPSLQSAYKLPSTSAAGLGQTVAVIAAFNDPTAVADLAAYRAAWGQPACATATGAGCLTVVNQNGAPSPLPPAPPGGDDWTTPASAEVDTVSAVCPNCHIVLVEASSDAGSGLYVSVNVAANLGAKFIAADFSGLESGDDVSEDTQDFSHPGVVITAPGSDDGTPWYPASSPDVISVGGTTLTAAANARGWTETAWTDSAGTCSSYETKPAWQTYAGCLRRTTNDVAADGDPNTGVATYDSYSQGGWFETGGTSIAAAIIAAAYALAGPPAPGTNPASALYAHASSLFDVTSGGPRDGCNPLSLCTAGAGFDGPTGLGTPNGIAAFQPAFANGSSRLLAGQIVKAGQDLVSPSGQYTLTVQTGGNVVVTGNGCTIWSAGTTGSGNYLTMQTDGNLVIYTSAGKALWDSKTNGTGSANYLSLQNDGNAIVFTSAAKNVWAAGRANGSRLCTGGVLHAGQALYSPSEKYELTMQTDGNLVAYDGTKAIWASGTKGSGTADYLTMQADGNLVVYTSASKAVWASGTKGTGTANYLLVQDDGNVVVYTSAGKSAWASGTAGK
jgi:hypothetical protein